MFLCIVFLMLSRLFIATLWSPAVKGLSSWLLMVMFILFSLRSCGILGQVWYLIVSFLDLCHLSYFSFLEMPFFKEQFDFKILIRTSDF